MGIGTRLPDFLVGSGTRNVREWRRPVAESVVKRREEEKWQDELWEAREFLEQFIATSKWKQHRESMRFECDLSLAELTELGRLPRADGVKCCRRLIRVPVINDAIGEALWRHLFDAMHAEVEGNLNDAKEAKEMARRAMSLPLPRILRSENRDREERKEERRRASAPDTNPVQAMQIAEKTQTPQLWLIQSCHLCSEKGKLCPMIPNDLKIPEPRQRRRSSIVTKLLRLPQPEPFREKTEEQKWAERQATLRSRAMKSIAGTLVRIGETLLEHTNGSKTHTLLD
jgi:hypothetical protein